MGNSHYFNILLMSNSGYEVLPGPAVINPAMSPTPFSNRVDFGTGHGFLHLMFEDVSLSVK